MAEEEGKIKIKYVVDDTQLQQAVNKAMGSFKQMSSTAEKEGNKVKDMFATMAKAAGGFFSVAAAMGFAKQIVAVRKEVESLEISFGTLLGSEEKAAGLMRELSQFAAKTPLQLNDLAKGAQMLLSFNVEAERVMPILHAIGDISMGDAGKLQSLTLAFSQMSSTGRLMGQDLLQMINAGFNPLTVIAEKTGKSVAQLKDEMSKGAISAKQVEEAFIAVTSEGGKFYNMLEKQSKGLGGSLSNLEGAIRDMMNEIGKSAQKPLTETVQWLTKLVQNYQKVGRVLADIVITYGAYKAATIAVAVAERIRYQATLAHMAGLTKLQAINEVLISQMKKLNKTMLANPYVLAAVAVAGLVTAVVRYNKAMKEARDVQKAYNEAVSQQQQIHDEQASRIQELIGIIQSETAAMYDKIKAYKEFAEMFPEVVKDYKRGNALTEEQKKIIDELVADQSRMNKLVANKELEEQKSLVESLKKDYADLKNAMDVLSKKGNYGVVPIDVQNREREVMSKYREFGGTREIVAARLKSEMEAQERILKEQVQNMKEADWAELPIEVKIKTRQTEIDQLKFKIISLQNELAKNPFKIGVQLEIDEAKKKLKELGNELDALQTPTQKQASGMTLSELSSEISKQKRETAKARAALNREKDASRIALLKTNLEAAEGREKELKEEYKSRTGKDYDQAVKDYQNRIKVEKENAEKLKQEVEKGEKEIEEARLEMRRQVEQEQINVMRDGSAKTIAQINHNYDVEIDAIKKKESELLNKLNEQRKNEWAQAGGKGTFEPLKELEGDDKKLIEELTRLAGELRNNQLVEVTQQILNNYKTYDQRMAEALKTYNEAIDAINKQNVQEDVKKSQKGEAWRQYQAAKNGINQEFASRSKDFEAWAAYVSNIALDKLNVLLEQAETELEAVNYADTDKVAQLNAQIELLKERIAALTAQKNAKNNINNILGVKPETVNKLNLASAVIGTLSGGIVNLIGDMSGLDDVTREVLNTVIEMGEEIANLAIEEAKMANDIGSDVAESVDNIAKSSDWITMIIKLAISAITLVAKQAKREAEKAKEETMRSIDEVFDYYERRMNDFEFYSMFDFVGGEEIINEMLDTLEYDKKHNRELDVTKHRLDAIYGAIEQINGSYADAPLERFSKTYEGYAQQINALSEKYLDAKNEYEEASESKKDEAKKEMDDYYKELEETIRNASKFLNEYLSEVFGGDAMSIAEKFGDALIEAFKSGSDAAVAFGNTVDEIMKNMARNLIIQQAIYPLVQEVFEKYKKQMMSQLKGSNMSAIDFWLEKLPQISKDLNDLLPEITNLWESYNDEIQNMAYGKESTSASSRGIAQASQDSIDELNGRMTMIQEHTAMLSGNMVTLVGNTNGILLSVKNIDQNVAAMEGRMNSMASDITNMRIDINYMRANGIEAN